MGFVKAKRTSGKLYKANLSRSEPGSVLILIIEG